MRMNQSLSGGHIRSATFCLGVVQVLAERGLMEQVDYLSTVSGGGYTGTLITSWIGRGKQFTDLGRPHGADPGPVRHVRQHAKYLSAADLKQRWLMLIETMAGMLLNWTAPFCAIAVLALIAYWAGPALQHELRVSAIVLAALTVVLTLLYGIALRIAPHTPDSGWGARRERGPNRAGDRRTACGSGLPAVSLCRAPALVCYGHRGDHGHRAARGNSFPADLPLSTGDEDCLGDRLTLAAGVAVPVLAVACLYFLRELAGRSVPLPLPLDRADGAWIVLAAAIVSGGFAAIALDVNATGLHKIYRDALARTFVDMEVRTDH